MKDCIIVTGSSGLIGSAFIDRIGEQFVEFGFDREGPPHPPPKTEHVIDCDLGSDESVANALNEARRLGGGRIASVIHLAAYYDFSGEPSPKYDEITVRGTERLLRGLRGFEVEQFVFSSTMLVHAPCEPGERINEDWPVEPKWDYPKSKVATEQLIREQHGNIPIVLLRIAGVYDDHCHSIPLAHQIQRIYERKLISRVFPGDTSRGQSFLHLDDLVDALVNVVERRRQLPPELVLLLGESETQSYEDLQREFSRLIHGEKWETKQIPKALAKTGAWLQDKMPFGEEPFIKPWMIDLADDHFALDITRARQMLGWEPKRSLRATLPAMVGALKADPPGWYKENHLEPPSDRNEETQTGAKNGLTPELKQTLMAARAQRLGEKPPPETAEATDATLRAPWAPFANMILGAWLLSAPFTSGYANQPMAWSDWGAGTLIVLFAALSINPRHAWAQWASAVAGVWLLFAPLVFWAPLAAAYNTDTLIGSLVIVFSVVLPRLPVERDSPGVEIPPGWSYNPSTWPQRAPVIAMAFLGFFIARYLTAYQLGYIPKVWDPFFPDGTRRVLESEVSRAFPISDAGLGAISYMIEALTGFIGGTRRWRTMPWMVVFFGILVVPLGVVSIVLVVLQPLAVGAWCTLCLITAFAMLIMISPAADEVIATIQFLLQSRREGKKFWPTFWKGARVEMQVPAPPRGSSTSSLWSALGMSRAPWTLLASTGLGVCLMFAPSIFQTQGAAANSDPLVGALIVTFAVIALGEVGRSLRWLNVLLGAWLMVSPWFLSGAVPASQWSNAIAGGVLIALSIPRGHIREQYGNFNRFII